MRPILCLCALPLLLAAITRGETPADAILTPILQKHRLPGLIAGRIENDRLVWVAAVGVRKAGNPTPMTATDQIHLGSDTKAMTAVLIGQLIDAHQLAFETTLAEIYPALAPRMHPQMGKITVRQLLTHTAGLPANVAWPVLEDAGDLPRQRRILVEFLTTRKPAFPPGSRFEYSNAGYTVLGAIIEQITGKPWETVIQQKLFGPLGMKTAGFGPPGVEGKIEQPWGHTVRPWARKTPVPVWGDNPAVMHPAGGVHCSLEDWGRFLSLFVGEHPAPILRKETLAELLTPSALESYAGGWGITRRDWAAGRLLTHAGSNTAWICIVWAAPDEHYAVMAATNLGTDEAAQACDEAISALVLLHPNGTMPATSPAR